MRSIRVLAFAVGVAGCGGGSRAVSLPAELPQHGFGAPGDAVRVSLVHTYSDFTGKFRDARSGAVAEQGLVWEFADPAPFWACFDGAVTKSFAEGDLPGAKAVLTIQAGPRTLWFHAYRGWASLEAPGADGKTTGGDWRFSPEATDRVVELLNRTPPAR